MKIIKNKNPKGVALIWALVVLLVIILIVTGILMMAQIYHKRENTSILQTKADYYARSGINIMSSQISSGTIEESDLPTGGTDSSKEFVVDIEDSEDGTIEVIEVTVVVKRDVASYQLNLEATYTRANVSSTVCGRMLKNSGVWQFDGFYTD